MARSKIHVLALFFLLLLVLQQVAEAADAYEDGGSVSTGDSSKTGKKDVTEKDKKGGSENDDDDSKKGKKDVSEKEKKDDSDKGKKDDSEKEKKDKKDDKEKGNNGNSGKGKKRGRGTCNIKKYKHCYKQERDCPDSCPYDCALECASCQPVCTSSSSPSPPSGSSPDYPTTPATPSPSTPKPTPPTTPTTPSPSTPKPTPPTTPATPSPSTPKPTPPTTPATPSPSTPKPTPPTTTPTPSTPYPTPPTTTPTPTTPKPTPPSTTPTPTPSTPSPTPPTTPSTPKPTPPSTTPTPSTPYPTPSTPSPTPPTTPSLSTTPTPSTPYPTPSTPSPTPPTTPSPSTPSTTPTPSTPSPSTPTTPTSSPPPDQSQAAGRRRARCRNRNYPACYGSEHVCPSACPGGCEVDCVTCKPVCKCDQPGAVCQDPRFIGGDGITFYFHGKKDRDFCILSDRNLHINAHFIGKRNPTMKRDFTWVQSIGILFGNHKLFLGALKTASWDDSVDRLAISFDGEPITLEETQGAKWQSESAPAFSVVRTADANGITVEAEGIFRITAKVVYITKEDSRIHNYGVTDDDSLAHLDLRFKFFSLSDQVSGVMGQTYRPDYVSRFNVAAKMPVLGGDREFRASNLFATDCAVGKFEGRSYGGAESLELPSMSCTSGLGGRGVVCKK